jgi:hypothetical protein
VSEKENVERCCLCDDPTERAGAGEDSIYLCNGMAGPLCKPCYDIIIAEARGTADAELAAALARAEKADREVAEWKEDAQWAANDTTDDGERHCSCVGPLRHELRSMNADRDRLAAENERLVARLPKDWAGIPVLPKDRVKLLGRDMTGEIESGVTAIVGSVASDHVWVHLGGAGEPVTWLSKDVVVQVESAARAAARDAQNTELTRRLNALVGESILPLTPAEPEGSGT